MTISKSIVRFQRDHGWSDDVGKLAEIMAAQVLVALNTIYVLSECECRWHHRCKFCRWQTLLPRAAEWRRRWCWRMGRTWWRGRGRRRGGGEKATWRPPALVRETEKLGTDGSMRQGRCRTRRWRRTPWWGASSWVSTTVLEALPNILKGCSMILNVYFL